MQRLVLTAGSLVADFQLSHGGLAKRELNKQLASSPFTRTWALYERVAETKETPPTRATPPAALRASESFASLDPVEEAAVLRAQQEEHAPALQRVGTPVEPQPRLAVTTHRVRLDGDLWARVVDEWPDLLKQEFTSDVCDATALPRTSMQRLVLTAGSLVADFQLSHGGLAKRELNKQLASSPFTRTWALYERVAETKETPPTRATPPAALRASESFAPLEAVEEAAVLRAQQEEHAPALQRVGTPVEPQPRLAVTTHRVRLDGDLWARVVDEWPDLLKQEFTSDVCDATALPRTSMQRLVLTAGSLVADFQLSHGGLAKRELNKQLASSPFTRTWALYERVAETKETPPTRATPPAALRASESFASLDPVEEAAVLRAQQEEHAPALQRVGTPVEPQPRLAVTTHRVRLDGDLWARVVDEWPDLLKQEFTSDVCDATALPRTSMQRLVLTAGSLVADFQLSHGGLAKRELNKQLASSPFTRTWALYERVAETKETPPTRATPPAALRASESFAPLEAVEEAAVLRAQQEEHAPALQRVGTPVEPQPRLAVTTHRVRLDGDLWARVVDEWPDLLKQEFTSDVCDATALPRTSMQRLVLTAGSLVADFQLSHGGLAKRELNKQLASSPFTRTWALYERVAETKETPPTRATPPAALRASESFASLDPVEEAAVLRAQQQEEPPVEAMTAFEEHAPALQRVGTPVEPHRGALEGASPVDARTATPPAALRASESFASLEAAEEAAVLRAQQEEEPPVEAMTAFEEHAPALQRVGTPVEPHRGALEGASPVDARTATPPAALRASESFASLDPVEEAAVLRAQQQEEPPVEAMTAFEEHAPALQRVGTPVEPQPRLAVTTHRVRLDGDLWARVVDEWPDLLKQEFTSDVCDATALPRTSMQRLVLTAGSLVADFQLSHGGLAKRELNKQLASSPFTRTWALYERVAETKETPPTRATPPAALRASESFASLDPVEEAAVLRAQQEEHAPALQRVGTPVEPQPRLAVTTHRVRLDGDLWARVVDEWPDLLKQEFTSDVCDATALPRTSMQRLVLTAGSLVADFQLSHGGLAKRELNKQLASSPFTRTWALYERVAETKETPPTRATPPAALRASESFASLERWRRPQCCVRSRRSMRQRCSASARRWSRSRASRSRHTGFAWTAICGRVSSTSGRTCSSRSSQATCAMPRRCRGRRCSGWCSQPAASSPTSSSRTEASRRGS
ncbi:Flagellar_Member_8 [Leishmania infantum]|uniref:Flagellar_Member_8 n=1 Tax=Leishmania infantum TaxID=5671 RepID=A0A6L0XNG0_LEIIN|nr:Flagellar_Member_8 [Leishmania infantum]SUZ45338.1 Flagellar_Member_8 [Leishmania infantum]